LNDTSSKTLVYTACSGAELPKKHKHLSQYLKCQNHMLGR